VNSVSFNLLPGEAVALVGPNGAGKSSLLKSMAGIEPASGLVTVRGRECHHKELGSHVAYVPQRSTARWDLPLTVLDVVVAGRRSVSRKWLRPSKVDEAAARECLAMFGIEPLFRRVIGSLSGGQAQRVLLARAMVQEPEVLLLDEPYTGLDVQSSGALSTVLLEMAKGGVTILCALHEIFIAKNVFARTIALNQVLIADGESQRVLTDSGIAKIFASVCSETEVD
jgi:ABC-type Mn2+/Zn2+ transport system ATPase subunit